jgi:hypothetical protein
VADELAFAVEEIPDADSVFMRVHRDFIRNGDLLPGAFKSQDGGMSVDWSKYASREDAKRRAKVPADHAVVSLLVGGIRKIDDLDVKHTPEPDNRAHSEVDLADNREQLTEVRFLLNRLAAIVIPLG